MQIRNTHVTSISMYLPIQRLATYHHFWKPAIFVLQILVFWKTPAGRGLLVPFPKKVTSLANCVVSWDALGALLRLCGFRCTACIAWSCHEWLPGTGKGWLDGMGCSEGETYGENGLKKFDCFITYVWPKIRRCLGPGKAGWRIHAVAELWLVLVWFDRRYAFHVFSFHALWRLLNEGWNWFEMQRLPSSVWAWWHLGAVMALKAAGVGLNWWKIKASPHKSYRQFGGWTWRDFACLLIYVLEFRLV